MSLDLAPRERSILRALVAEHTATGEPIGSRTITARHDLGLSAASVRSVLAQLEAMGLAWQPHSSAGRVPTQQGFRYYVDALIEPKAPPARERSALDELLGHHDPSETKLRSAARLVSELMGAVTVLSAPSAEHAVLATVRFVPMGPGRLVAVLATRGGSVEHRTVDETNRFDDDELERLHNFLELHAPGRTLAELRDLVAADVEGARRELGLIHLRLECWLGDVLARSQSEASGRLAIEGRANLFQHREFLDAERLRSYVDAFESRTRWLELLERTLDSADTAIAIGDEAVPVGLADAGIVAVRFGRGGSSGILAAVGPLRFDYARALPLLRYAARSMSHALDGSGNDCDDSP